MASNGQEFQPMDPNYQPINWGLLAQQDRIQKQPAPQQKNPGVLSSILGSIGGFAKSVNPLPNALMNPGQTGNELIQAIQHPNLKTIGSAASELLPGSVKNAGEESINAALHPAQTVNNAVNALPQAGAIALPIAADIATGGTGIPADVALASAGAGGGQALKNLIQGKSAGSGVLGQAALGGVTQGVGEGIIGPIAGKVIGGLAPEAESGAEDLASQATGNIKTNALQKIGGSLQKPAIGATAPPSPFGATKEADIIANLKSEGLIKAGDNAQTIYEKLPGHMSQYQGQISDILSKDTTPISADDLTKQVEDAVTQNNHFLGTDSASQTALDNTKAAIAKAADENGNLTSQQVYDLKGEMQQELSRAYDKVAKGAPLTGGEDALIAARNAVNDQLPGDAKALGQKQSMLYDSADGLNQARNIQARTPSFLGGLPRFGSKGVSHAAQSVGTAVGVPVEAAGNAIAANPAGNKTVASLLQALAPTLQSMSPEGQDNFKQTLQDNAEQNFQNPSTLGATNQPVEQSPYPEQNLMSDIQRDPKHASDYESIYAALKPASDTKLTATQQGNVSDAQTALDALKQLEGGGQGTGGTAANIPLIGGLIDSSGSNYNSNVQASAPAILQAAIGSSSPAALKANAGLLPSSSDSPEVVSQKVARLRSLIQQSLEEQASAPQTQGDLQALFQ